METTTIALTKDVREGIKQFGNKGESYSEILTRLLESARKRMLHDFLMSDEGCIPIEEALSNAKKKWQ